MTRTFPSPVETAEDLPGWCGRCGRVMRRTDHRSGWDRFTGRPNDSTPAVECPKWGGNPANHEAFVVMPRPPVIPMPSRCTCTQTPTGLIPTTINCPVHGSWTNTGTGA